MLTNVPLSSHTPPSSPPSALLRFLDAFSPPRWLQRTVCCLVLGGQSFWRIARGKIHWKNTVDQLLLVGPRSLGVALLTSSFVGMVFTIQFVREFARMGLTRSVGGVLGLALSRELTPVVTAIIMAGRVGSAFAAELGTMAVSEQTDSLRVLGTDPTDYLVVPRAGPLLGSPDDHEIAAPALVLVYPPQGLRGASRDASAQHHARGGRRAEEALHGERDEGVAGREA